ncbi:hypothetical protein SAMN02910358_01333 [Lachnospiraceae bacterium XBB1006]|nr:hypothetical protein SAMN02910358_01333 [Lachnospiraceae bacterium XBB1006]
MNNYIGMLRKMGEVSISEVCGGLCSESLYGNFENGRRELDVFVQLRVLERLGCDTSRLQFFLQGKEYMRWAQRAEIIQAIENDNFEMATKLIDDFREAYRKEKMQLQFAERMASFVAIKNGEDSTVIAEHVKNALQLTVPHYKTAGNRRQLLAAIEMDMILDYYYYSDPLNDERLLEICKGIEEARWHISDKGEVYPKAVLYYCKVIEQRIPMEKWGAARLVGCEQLLSKALQYLRTEKKGRFMLETLQLRETILSNLITKYGLEGDYGEERRKNTVSLRAMEKSEEFCREFACSWGAFNLYKIRKVDCIGDVIRKRMKMLEIDEKKLAKEMNVDVRTIRNMQSKESKPHKGTVEEILYYMGLPREYRKYIYMVRDEKEKQLVEKHVRSILYGEGENPETIRKELEGVLDLDNEQNNRLLRWYKVLDEYQNGTFGRYATSERIKGIIEECFPLPCIQKSGEKYFSLCELQYLCSYLQRLEKGDRDYDKVLEFGKAYCEEIIENRQSDNFASTLKMLYHQVESEYGNMGEFAISNEIAWVIVQAARESNDLYSLEDILYTFWWNKREETNTADKEMLYWLIDLAILIQDSRSEKFLKEAKAKMH